MLELDSDSAWRERICNAMTSSAAEMIADVMDMTLLLACGGETFILSVQSIRVRPIAVGLGVAQEAARTQSRDDSAR